MSRTKPAERTPSAPTLIIKDHQPQRVRDVRDLAAALLCLAGLVVVIVACLLLNGTLQGAEKDVVRASHVSSLRWLVDLPMNFIQTAVLLILFAAVLFRLLTNRMWAQTLSAVLGQLVGFGLAVVFSLILPLIASNMRVFFLAPVISSVGLGPFELYTATTAFLSAAGNRRGSSRLRWAWNVFAVLIALELITSSITIPAAGVALLIGNFVGLLIRFAIGSPNQGIWGSQLASALEQVGVHPEKMSRRTDVSESNPGLSFSDDLTELSRIYHVRDRDGQRLTVSVNDEQRHSKGYLSQIWQTIKLEGLSTRRYDNAHDLSEHHITMLLALRKIGLTVPQPVAMGDTGASSFIVFRSPEKGRHAHQLDLAHASDQQIEHIFTELERAHSRGITHRNITASCLGVIPPRPTQKDETIALPHMSREQLLAAHNSGDDGEAILCGWAHGDLASTQGHIQMDRVQLITLLAATIGVKRTLACAQKVYTPVQLASLVPYVQAVLIPQQTRQLPGWNHKILSTLRTQINQLTPHEQELEQSQPVHLSRFSVRRFVTILLLLIALIAVFTQLNFNEMITAVKSANPWWAVASCVMGIISWLGSAIAFGVFIPREKRHGHILGIIGTQAVASFTAVSMPVAAGPLTVNTIFLKKIGLDNTHAVATSTADTVAEFTTTFLMFIVLGLFTGSNSLKNALPGQTILIVVGVLAAIIAIIMLIPPLRKYIVTKWGTAIRNYWHEIVTLFSQPSILLISMIGSIIQNTTLAAGFWMSLLAFGYHLNFIETLFIFLLSNAIGSAAPTPGGLGAVETVVSVAFTSVGVPSTIAVSATLLFRLASYWLRMVLGYIYMKWMQKRNLL
jgi:uncharacterized protein (TIRG00374 family)